MIFRKRNKRSGFTQIANAVLQDARLSFAARGIFCYLFSKTDDWKPILSDLEKAGDLKKYALRGALKELSEFGYSRRVRITDAKGHVLRHEVFLFEDTADSAHVKEGATVPIDRIEAVLSGEATVGFSTSGETSQTPEIDSTVRFSGTQKPHPTQYEMGRNIRKVDAIASTATADADRDSGTAFAEDSEPSPEDVAAYMAECEQEEQGGGPEEAQGAEPATTTPPRIDTGSVAQPDGQGALPGADVEPDARAFPWREVCAIFTAHVPEVTMPDRGSRRDAGIKAFWRKHGKTTGVFHLLAQRVAESDWLMARNGHDGCQGRPYSWGWIFAKDQRGQWRCDRIMAGDYDNDRMAFVLEKKAKAAGPVLTRVMLPGDRRWTEVDLAEKLPDGQARYRVVGEHVANGLPEVIDRKC